MLRISETIPLKRDSIFDWNGHFLTNALVTIQSKIESLFRGIVTSSLRYRPSRTCLPPTCERVLRRVIFPQKNFKILKFWAKKGSKRPPTKTPRFCEIFRFPRDFVKSGGLAGNLGRSGRAHGVFWGYFYRFLPDFRVYLLLKGFVPKKSKIAILGQNRAFFHKNEVPEGKKFNPLYGPLFGAKAPRF